MTTRRPKDDPGATPDTSWRRTRQGPMNIGTFTGRLAKPALGKRGFSGVEILSHWATIVGPELAALAVPLEVKYPRGRNAGATLHLRVAPGGAATMLQMKIPAVIARVNRFFGYEAVAQVKAAQGPLPPKKRPPPPPKPLSATALAKVEGEVAGVTSEALKTALLKLGKTLQQRGR